MANQRDVFIALCEAWNYYLEKKTSNKQYYNDKTANAGSNNWQRFSYIYDQNMGTGKDGYAWCATNICACLIESVGLEETKRLMLNTVSASCTQIRNAFKNANRFYKSPQRGDFVIFSDSAGDPAHIGVVKEVTASYIYTVEGNTSAGSTVIANGGGVHEKSYNRSDSRILGYCRPDWREVTLIPDKNGCPYPEPKQLVSKGDLGIGVKWVQWHLSQAGYLVGAIDGDFGSNTDAAARKSQKDNGLTVDGIVGAATKAALQKAVEKEEPEPPPVEPEPPEEDDMDMNKFKELMAKYQRELKDNDCGPWSEEARLWALENGLFIGSDTTDSGEPNFMWEDTLTREQAAQLFYRFAQIVLKI